MLRSFYGNETDNWNDDPTATKSYDDIGESKEKPVKKKLVVAKRATRKLALKKMKSKIKMKGK